MITHIVPGDITGPDNKKDIIIGMNTSREELTALSEEFLGQNIPRELIQLGSILTFEFDENRLIHMIVCHNACDNGWRNAHQYVRYGLDTLWVHAPHRDHSIVQIGNGVVGKKYGAEPLKIQRAMAESYLKLTLYKRPEGSPVSVKRKKPVFLYGHNLKPVEA